MAKDGEKKMLKKAAKEERKNICVRFSGEERDEIQKLADEYCDGKLSEWIRTAALSWKPSEDDLA